MPSYKLTYFDGRGRPEPIRMIFALAGVKYDDIRLSDEDWEELKASGKTPFGQLPILEVDGVVLAQSLSIMTYVAEQYGLVPSRAIDNARASMVVHAIYDTGEKIMAFMYEWDDDKKEEMKKEFFENHLPQQLANLEKVLKSNARGKGYFAGDKVSYADINFFSFMNGFLVDGKIDTPKELHDFLCLLGLYNRILKVPTMQEWMKNRPETEI